MTQRPVIVGASRLLNRRTTSPHFCAMGSHFSCDHRNFGERLEGIYSARGHSMGMQLFGPASVLPCRARTASYQAFNVAESVSTAFLRTSSRPSLRSVTNSAAL